MGYTASEFIGTFWTTFDGDYYVSTIGRDTYNGSPKQPFLTVAKAFEVAVDGDKIVVGPDEYVLYGQDENNPSGAELPCRVAAPGHIFLNTEGNGINIDQVPLNDGDRVLAWKQAGPAENGIYIYSGGSLQRDPNFNSGENIVPGKLIPILEGETNGKAIFQLTTTDPINIGSTLLTFEKIITDTEWSKISGEITTNTDLQDELDLKANATDLTGTISDIKGGAPTEGDNLNKLYNLIQGKVGVSASANDITDRDSQKANLEDQQNIYVADASIDSTVESGWAVYKYLDTSDSFIKIAEQESIDLVLEKTSKPEAEAGIDDNKYMTAAKSYDGWQSWVQNKIVSDLETSSETIIGAINELNMSRVDFGSSAADQIPFMSNDHSALEFSNKFKYDGQRLTTEGIGNSSLAVGENASSNGFNSIAVGSNAISIGDYSIGIGLDALTTAQQQICIGRSAGLNSTGGINSINIGTSVNVGFSDIEQDVIAIGQRAMATKSAQISIGKEAGASSSTDIREHSISIGPWANSTTYKIGWSSVALGSYAISSGSYSVAIGFSAQTNFPGGIAIGDRIISNNINSVIIGSGAGVGNSSNNIQDSLEVTFSGFSVFKAGRTIGTGITTNASPDTNLTDAVDGVIAYDSTNHEFRAFVNGGWTSLSGIDGGNSLSLGTLGQIPFMNSTSDFTYTNDLRFIGSNLQTETSGFKVNGGTDSFIEMQRNSSQIFGADMSYFSGRSPHISIPNLALIGESTNDNGTVPILALSSSIAEGFATPTAVAARPTLAGYNHTNKQWEVGADGNWNFQGNDLNNIGTGTANTNWAVTSDQRLKSVIDNLPDALGLVRNMQGHRFIRTDLNDGINRIGFMAQQVNNILPEVVNEKNDTWSMDYASITALHNEAIKTVDNELSTLKQKVKELELKLNKHGITC